MKRVSWVNLGLGIWLLVAPLILNTSGIALVSSVLSGILVIVLAALSLRAPLRNHVTAWMSLAAGMWVFFSPWILNFNSQTPVVAKSALTGALIMIFSIARGSASEERSAI